MKKNYSWIVCIGCTLLVFCTLGLVASAFSVYQPFITSYGNLTKTESAFIITIRSALSVASMFFVNHYYMHLGIRRGMTVSIFISAIAFVLYGISDNFIMYCISAAVAGISHGVGGMYAASLLLHRWFVSHRGLALGICSAGSGFASILVPPFVTLLIDATSLRTTFIAEACFIALTGLFVFLVIRDHPEDMGLAPLKDTKEKGPEKQREEVLRTVTAFGKPLMCMYFAAFLLGMVCNGCLANLTMLYSTEGFNAMTVSFLASLAGFSQTAGKFIYGHVADLIGEQKTGMVTYALLIFGMVLACFASNGSYPVALIAMTLAGIGIPLYSVGISLYARQISSQEDYPLILKRLQLLCVFGGLAFSVFPGVICDLTGSYVGAYAILAVSAVVSMILVKLSYVLRDKEEVPAAAQRSL